MNKTKNILYVDSDKEFVRGFKEQLEKNETVAECHLNFVFAASCSEALKKLDGAETDLIVLEILLPVVNGYYLLKTLKKEKRKVPVVLYTRLKGPQDLARMTSSGADNIFIKPLTKPEDLIQAIISGEWRKADIGQTILELQSRIKSLSDTETQSRLKVVQCPRCHLILARNSFFCSNCGQKIFKSAEKQ